MRGDIESYAFISSQDEGGFDAECERGLVCCQIGECFLVQGARGGGESVEEGYVGGEVVDGFGEVFGAQGGEEFFGGGVET